MRDYAFTIIDLVRNPEGELLAVSKGAWGYLTYHYTCNDTCIDEYRENTYLFKRKTDIKRIRPSKVKDAIIDKINASILRENISAMAYAMEQAEEQLRVFLEKNEHYGRDVFRDLPPHLAHIGNAGEMLERGGRNYSNFLTLVMEHRVGLYTLSIHRDPQRWQRGENNGTAQKKG
jgi:hypothetical protein